MEVKSRGWYQLLVGKDVRLSFHGSVSEDSYCISFICFIFLSRLSVVMMLLNRGPNPEWVCLGPAGSAWVLDFVQARFDKQVQVVMRERLLKLGTVK